MTAGSIIKVERGTCSSAPIPLDKKSCPRTYICCNDERFNFVFTRKEDADENPLLPTIVDRDAYDYGVIIRKGTDTTDNFTGSLDEVVPLSYAQINKPEQGEEWYKAKYPELPDEFFGILARYTWGEKFTKKEIKNETKKYQRKNKKKGKEPPIGLQILKGSHTIVFD